jgi:aquaporin rerated protein, other eukaryote
MALSYIALSFGFSLMVNAWVFYRISGGLFNPAVSLAMVLTGGITWFRAGILTVAQILGAILASGLVKGLFPEQFNVNTSLSDSTSLARGFSIEAILTMELVFTVRINI